MDILFLIESVHHVGDIRMTKYLTHLIDDMRECGLKSCPRHVIEKVTEKRIGQSKELTSLRT
jgi:hypothetical protein